MTDDQIDFRSTDSPSDVVSPNLPSDDMRVLADAAFKRAGLETKWRKREAQDEDAEEQYLLRVGIPNGRQLRWIAINESRAQFTNSICVRPAIALGEYEALLYTDTFEIEAQLRPLAPFGSPTTIWRLSRLPGVVDTSRNPMMLLKDKAMKPMGRLAKVGLCLLLLILIRLGPPA